MSREETKDIPMTLCDACRDLYNAPPTVAPHSTLKKDPVEIFDYSIAGKGLKLLESYSCEASGCEAKYSRLIGDRWVLSNERA